MKIGSFSRELYFKFASSDYFIPLDDKNANLVPQGQGNPLRINIVMEGVQRVVARIVVIAAISIVFAPIGAIYHGTMVLFRVTRYVIGVR